jgi:hypothetical protein
MYYYRIKAAVCRFFEPEAGQVTKIRKEEIRKEESHSS